MTLTTCIYNDGQIMANRIGARYYMECSALTGENVNAVFEGCVLASLGLRSRTVLQNGYLVRTPKIEKIKKNKDLGLQRTVRIYTGLELLPIFMYERVRAYEFI